MTFGEAQVYVSGSLVTHEGVRNVTFTIEGGKPVWTVTKPQKGLEGSPRATYSTNTYGTEATWLQQVCGKAIEKLPSHLYVQLTKELELPSPTLQQKLLSKVVLYDERTLIALHSSTKETKQSLLALVKNGSPAYNDFMRMAPRYASRDTVLLPSSSWHQIDSVVSIVAGQNVAKVIVRESAFWESSGRVRYDVENVLHTYTLHLVNNEWLIVSDEF